MMGKLKEAAKAVGPVGKIGGAVKSAMPSGGLKPMPRPVNTEMRSRIAMKAKAMMGKKA